MADRNIFDRYVLALRKTAIDDKTEHSDRGALQTLLQTIADESAKGTHVQHEPKHVAEKGAPDFKITKSGLIVGYVENKKIGENLDKVLKSDQIKRYRSLSHNILLTDYLHFVWINKDGIQRETLCHVTDVEHPKFKLHDDRIVAVRDLIAGFFSSAPEGIGRAQQLAIALAMRSRLLRDYLGEELVRQEREHKEEKLYGLFQIFRDQVFHELTLNEFADAFAQMLAYGLFLARLNSGEQPVTLHNAREFVPGSFSLIRELVEFLSELNKKEYRDVRWVVEEVLSIVNALKLPAILEDLSFRNRKAISRKVKASDEEEHRLFERDPFIYFYEDYLKAYDKTTRKSRGVYYTPPPIVNFIVRAIDDILKDSFGIKDGLADHKRVTVLDFACGTGTFLLEVFQHIFDNIGGADSAKAGLIVRDHILKNLYGFEYLIAPYTIAHLKLSQYLKDQNHPLKDGERLQVFLTNTLEPIDPAPQFLLPAITAETKAAQAVKDKPILVITGNPPYSGHSKNKGAWISAAIDGYKYTVETDEAGREFNKPLGERNPKWLNDDYVKFMRFAQLKMDAVSEGIVGIITNHSWLDNPTFRGMRQSLMRSFEQIYVLDLHGNAKKKETAPDGSKDENVFDIEQGVAISIFVKRAGLERGVWRGDVWGKRLEKYLETSIASLASTHFSELTPNAPHYLFSAENVDLRSEYDQGRGVPELFNINVLGFQTHRDDFAISFTSEEMGQKLKELANEKTPISDIVTKYDVNEKWALDARAQMQKRSPEPIRSVLYRPFDHRFAEYSRLLNDRPRRELLDNVIGRENLVIGVGRAGNAVPERPWELALVSTFAIDANVFRRGGISLSPLYCYNNEKRGESFTADFRAFLDSRYDNHYTPEEILGYIYAILHAPTYRSRYAEFLRIDFPRIPFPESSDDFENLSGLGWALIQAHLLREFPRGELAGYHGQGKKDSDHKVDAVRYSPEEQAVFINKTQCFKLVPPHVWEFHIGGYQVIDKYLKSRKGRTLSLDEINHVAAIADSLAFTIGQMAKIDVTYTQAFSSGG